jgi:hypothetical protein
MQMIEKTIHYLIGAGQVKKEVLNLGHSY